MSEPDIEIRPFDRHAAAESDCAAWNACSNRLRAENLPEDPPIPLEETVRTMPIDWPASDLYLWAAWNGDEIVGTSRLSVGHTGENDHLADFNVSVLPEWRRQRIGTQLLAPVSGAAREAG